ncbi:MAG: isoprenylcysteine carboxylmethyltransferase family protein [Planctomycetes bacterium]|nr:isoprenylcysteine carboxylmethyltransferase family protein [Planctomycetota bacterium]
MNDTDNAFAEGPPKARKQPKIKDGKQREKRLDRLRLQGFWPLYACFVLLAWTAPLGEEHAWQSAIRFTGLGVTLLGVLMRIWSNGYLLKKEELATAGPYGRTRNPLYVGTWLIGCGLALNTAWPWNVMLLGFYNVMFFSIYKSQIRIEEEMLASIYGEPYAEYCENVPRFFPGLRPWRKGSVSAFSLSRALRNRSWEPILGVAILWGAQMFMWSLGKPMIDGRSFSTAWQAFLGGAWIGI